MNYTQTEDRRAMDRLAADVAALELTPQSPPVRRRHLVKWCERCMTAARKSLSSRAQQDATGGTDAPARDSLKPGVLGEFPAVPLAAHNGIEGELLSEGDRPSGRTIDAGPVHKDHHASVCDPAAVVPRTCRRCGVSERHVALDGRALCHQCPPPPLPPVPAPPAPRTLADHVVRLIGDGDDTLTIECEFAVEYRVEAGSPSTRDHPGEPTRVVPTACYLPPAVASAVMRNLEHELRTTAFRTDARGMLDPASIETFVREAGPKVLDVLGALQSECDDLAAAVPDPERFADEGGAQ